jgi:hypothetical protein
MDKDRDILGTLDVGQAVVKLQGRTVRPFEIKLPLFAIDKGKITDEFIKEHMKDIVSVYPQEDFRLNWQNNNQPPNKTLDIEIAFLKDVADYPDSGIAARYKRLGLSVRQGQKIKNKLLEKQFIQENTEKTPTGKLNKITLAEKAKTDPANNRIK